MRDTEIHGGRGIDPVPRPRLPARRLVAVAPLAVAGAAFLAACGGGTGPAASGSPSAAGSAALISTRTIAKVGTVLVDSSGRTLYSPDQEADGNILCTGSCLGFWFPLTTASTTPTATTTLPGVLSTIRRPDSHKLQATYQGKPLYTFRLDQAPGQAMGNGFNDSFGANSFNWHAIVTSAAGPGTPAPAPTPPPAPSGNNSGSYSYP